MPVPAHNRYTLSGVFGPVATPVEIWSWSFATGPEVFASQADRDARAAAVETAWKNHLANVSLSTTVLTKVTMAQKNAGGLTSKNADGSYNQGEAVVAGGAGQSASAVKMPLQTALCVSLDTARAGATGRGRFFLPWPGFSIGTDFRLSTGDRDSVALAVKNFLDAVNALVVTPGTQDDVCVPSGYGHLSRVTSIRVGRVPDTMRSRRGDLDEQYASLALT